MGKERLPKHLRIQIKGWICSIILLVFLLALLAAVIRTPFEEEVMDEGEGNQAPSPSEQETIQDSVRQIQSKIQKMGEIRVLLRNDGYEGLFHDRVSLRGSKDLRVTEEKEGRSKDDRLPAGEELTFRKGIGFFEDGQGVLTVSALDPEGEILIDLERAEGVPGYRGKLEIRAVDEGLLIINQLPVEEYLRYVVPSEMPANYPEEALKAQAICARTYAYGKMLWPGYEEFDAHLDDSTAFQVYHNCDEQEKTTKAIRETAGTVLWTKAGKLADTYYYSTSCGRGTGAEIWMDEGEMGPDYLNAKQLTRTSVKAWQEKAPLLMGPWEADRDAEFLLEEREDDYECEEAWYRWHYDCLELSAEKFLRKLREVTGNKEITFMEIQDLEVTRRGDGGIAAELCITTDGGRFAVCGEGAIRRLLCDGEGKVTLRDGSVYCPKEMLPSAFFLLAPRFEGKNVVGYSLIGGGLGHGVGMSQNCARQMAKEGMSAAEILGFFYQGCVLGPIY